MREVELKSVVDDVAERRARIESAGARLVYAGRLLDRRYDFPDRSMSSRDHVLRLRIYENAEGTRALLDWKGETKYEHGSLMDSHRWAPLAVFDSRIVGLFWVAVNS